MINNPSACPCGSEKQYNNCCLPLINLQTYAASPEALMRSRFSAYAKLNYQYVLNTYAKEARSKLTIAQLKSGNESTKWLKLEVLSAFSDNNEGEVEFIAYYQIHKDFYCMHERSRFILEEGQWRYLNGDMLNKSGRINITRNQTCLCGSQLKYKRCCGK